MITPGLVSITFRKLSVAEIVSLVSKAGLNGIEWGGDVHVPHGDLDAARAAKQLTLDAGIVIPSYGSYYRAGFDDTRYESVLETAVTLGAPVLRVWAGKKGAEEADVEYRAAVVEDLQRIGEMSEAAGIRVACEYHGWSLTDSTEASLSLMNEVAHPNVGMYWQPKPELGVDYGVEGIGFLAQYLVNVHVFHWSGRERRPLQEGERDWARYLDAIEATGRDHWALLEFTRDDSPDGFLADAATLLRLLGTARKALL